MRHYALWCVRFYFSVAIAFLAVSGSETQGQPTVSSALAGFDGTLFIAREDLNRLAAGEVWNPEGIRLGSFDLPKLYGVDQVGGPPVFVINGKYLTTVYHMPKARCGEWNTPDSVTHKRCYFKGRTGDPARMIRVIDYLIGLEAPKKS